MNSTLIFTCRPIGFSATFATLVRQFTSHSPDGAFIVCGKAVFDEAQKTVDLSQ